MDYLEHDGEAAGVAATLAATNAATLPRMEIVEERRRLHDANFRSRVVAAASAPGTRVEEVAQRYGIRTSLIYRWRRATSDPTLNAPAVKLVPVHVAETRKSEPSAAAARSKPETKRVGQIEIELENGIRVRVDTDVSVAALRRIVSKRELTPTFRMVLELLTLPAVDGGAAGDGIGRGLIRGS